MEYNKRDDFDAKLIFALKKISSSESKILDNTCLEKLLIHIRCEFNNRQEDYAHFEELVEFLSHLLETWSENHPSLHIKEFIYQFIGILWQNEQTFNKLQKLNINNNLVDILKPDLLDNTTLTVIYMKLLFDVLNHNSGYEWVKNSQQWKVVIKLYYLSSNLFVEREGSKFIKKLINKTTSDDLLINEIIQEVLSPLNENAGELFKNKNIYSKLPLIFRLLETMLRVLIFSENNIFLKITQTFDIEPHIKSCIENSEEGRVLDSALTLYVVLLIMKFEDKRLLLSMECIPSGLLDIFYILLKKDCIETIIRLAKCCQILWSDIKNQFKCESKISIHFIILQLIPALVVKKKLPDTKLFDLFVQKVFSLISETTQKLGYSFRDVIKSGSNNSKLRDWALKSVFIAVTNIETLTHDEAVIVFQSMAYILKAFVSNCDEDICTDDNSDKEISICVEDEPLLSAIINALCILIEKFKINWTASLESLCLLKMTSTLLKYPQLSPIVVVQTLSLVKLGILNFMSPNLALLLNNTEDSSFECLIPLLYKRLHDPVWEIRDSCIEVVTTISELAESKYPAFQQLLIEKDFCSLVFDIMEGDSESYVRASALRTLSAMTKIETLRHCLVTQNFPSKVIKLLQTESEGIVRREAALLIKEVYLTLNEQTEIVHSFYEIMGYTALCDLHWEVKVNSLIFWEAVVHHVIADQGMIDGSFPKVTFSKEHKKIVTLTNSEIKLRLDKVVKELSKIGCLYVLMSTLNDDCDFPVVKKSAQILSDFLEILKRYDVIGVSQEIPIGNKFPIKRKSSEKNNFEKRKPPNSIITTDDIMSEDAPDNPNNQLDCSDAVIEGIVNEIDINLLANVCQQKKENVGVEKKIVLQEVSPEIFLKQMESFDCERFLDEREKWFMNVEINLKSISDFVISDWSSDMNVMDCY